MDILQRNGWKQAIDNSGEPVPEALCYVYMDHGTDILAPLYTDPELTHLQANPLTAGPDGTFPDVHLPDGPYTIAVYTVSRKTLLGVDSGRGQDRITRP